MKKDILKCECEFSNVHNFLAKAPERKAVPIEKMLEVADELLSRIPLQYLVRHADDDIKSLVKSKQ